MPDRRVTAILADDHPMILEGLVKLLDGGVDVVATVTDGQALLEAVARRRPDLVVADISMPGIDGLEATRRLRALAPATRVVILSVQSEISWVRAALDAGAWGYVTKTAAAEEIRDAIREVASGRAYISPGLSHGLALPARPAAADGREPPAADAMTLTSREQDIVRLVGRGASNQDIADRLGIAVTTVRTHLGNVYLKLGRANRVELALYAAQNLGEER